MIIQRLPSGRYEAMTNAEGVGILTGWGFIHIELVAYGDSFSEAINNCLDKVELFLSDKRNGDYKLNENEEDED